MVLYYTKDICSHNENNKEKVTFTLHLPLLFCLSDNLCFASAKLCVIIKCMSNILIQNGLLIDTEWKRRADILIRGSRIVKIAPHIDPAKEGDNITVVHADGYMVLPGIIDAHTHYHLISRGTVTADSFREGSRSAAFGGVTTVIDFADDNKVSLKESARERINAMGSEMCIDFALHQGVYAFREGLFEELEEIKKMGVGTIKLFTTYRNVGYLIEKRDEIKKLYEMCKKLNLMVSVHCEDNTIIEDLSANWKGEFRPQDHADLRPAEAEAKAIEYVGGIALEVGHPLYVVHLSSAKGLEAVRRLRDKGLKVIVETTPHYLFLDRSMLEGENGPLYVMTPPLREKSDNEALKEALCNGEIQVVATDHCSFTREQKLSSNDCRSIYPGIPGSEELLPLVHTMVAHGEQLTINEMVNLLSTGPAKYFGLYPEKGVLREGSDADIVIFNPDVAWTLSASNTHSAAHYTPYEGFNVVGRAVMTYLRGRLVAGEGVFLGIPGDGRFVKAVRK